MIRHVLCAALLALVAATPALAHHAAEGIISDDVWQRIDEALADTPHLNLDFDDVMGTMTVETFGNRPGDLALTTTIVVYTQDADAYLAAIDVVLDDMQRGPQGDTNDNPASGMFVEVIDLSGGLTEITLVEPIGNGESQPSNDASQPGARRGGG